MSIGQGSGITQRTSGTTGAVVYKGTLDASGGVYPSSPSNGDYYIISVAGTISGVSYLVGDWAVYNGSVWEKVVGEETDVLHTDIAAEISALTDKATPVDADVVLGEDSAATPTAFTKIKITWAHIKATLKTYFDNIYLGIGSIVDVSSGADYQVVNTDFGSGKNLLMTDGYKFILPTQANMAGYLGRPLRIIKSTTATVTIQANTGQTIDNSSVVGTIYADQSSEKSSIILVAISATQFVIQSFNGTWTET